MLRDICARRGITLRSYSDDWVLEITNGTQTHWVFGQNFDLNSQANAAIAADKVACSVLLDEYGVPHVPHYLLDRRSQERADLGQIENALRGGSLVMKPLRGHSGEHVSKVDTVQQARDVLTQNPGVTWAYSPHRNIESETRIVVVDEQVELTLRKTKPADRDGLKLFNLSKGATAVRVGVDEISNEVSKMAMYAVRALGLRMAAVDIVTLQDGSNEVLEANAIFSLMRYAKMNDATYSEVASFYDRLLVKLFTR